VKKDNLKATFKSSSQFGATSSPKNERSEMKSDSNTTSFHIARVFKGVKKYLSTGPKSDIPERLETDDMSEKSIDSQEELIMVPQP